MNYFLDNLNSSYNQKSCSVKNEDDTAAYYEADKNKIFNSSNYLPIITNMKPIDESNSINFISNRSLETSNASTSSLTSSPSSISVNNSIECKNDSSSWLSKGPLYLKSHLQSTSNRYSFTEKKKNRNLASSNENTSTESFRYTTTTSSSNRCLDDLEASNSKLKSNFNKSFSFNNFNHFRKYSVDNVGISASTRYLSQRKQLAKAYVSSSSLKLTRSVYNKKSNQPFDKNYVDKPSFDRQISSSKSELSTLGDHSQKSFTKLQKLTLLCILTVSFCSYCSCSILAPFFPLKASQKGLTETQAGFIFSVFAFISVIFSPFLGNSLFLNRIIFILNLN